MKDGALKKSMGEFISSTEVDERYAQYVLKFGAQGGRLLGAGGSGFILVSVDPNRLQGEFFKHKCKSHQMFPIERIEIDTSWRKNSLRGK